MHPYDDPAVIAGQGTVGLEMLADHPALDALVVPIGGGGLISGIAVAAKALEARYRDLRRRVGALPRNVARCCAARSPTAGRRHHRRRHRRQGPGKITRRIVKALVEDILLVRERAGKRAVGMLMIAKSVAEGAGAAGLAA